MTRWLSERESLAKLGILTACCTSCYYDVADGIEICEASTRDYAYAIECCCEHAEALQMAFDEGKLP